MVSPSPFPRTPLAVIVGRQRWIARSLESVLAAHGYAVLRAPADDGALERMADSDPDLVLVEAEAGADEWSLLQGATSERPGLRACTPVVGLTTEPLSRERRLAALRAGAWEVLGLPFDAEELLLKLGAFVRAKIEADESRDHGLLDPITEVYNVRGILRRIHEQGAEASRYGRALACVVVAPDLPGEGPVPPELPREVARSLRDVARASDVVGRLGQTEFAVVAPETGADGARDLARRLIDGTEVVGAVGAEGGISLRLRAGYAAAARLDPSAPGEPVELLARATVALRRAQSGGRGDRIRSAD